MNVMTDIFIRVFGWANVFFSAGFTFMIQSTVILLVGLSLRQILRNKSMAAQSLVLRFCLIAVFLVPLVTLLYSVSGIERLYLSVPSPDIRAIHFIDDSGKGSDTAITVEQRNDAQNDPLLSDTSGATTGNASSSPSATSTSRPQNDTPDSHKSAGNTVRFWISILLVPSFTGAWIVLSLLLLTGEIASIKKTNAIIRQAVPAEESLTETVRRMAGSLGVKPPRIVKHPNAGSAFLTGIFTPVIVLPSGDLEKHMITKEVLLHELAHLKRRDHIWNLIANTGLVILPLQPLLWILASGVEESGDHVCDDYVVRLIKDDRGYATQLYDIANVYRMKRAKLAAGSGIFSVKSVLLRRIEHILDSSRIRNLNSRARDVLSVAFLFSCSMFVSGFVGIKREFMNLRDHIVGNAAVFTSRLHTPETNTDHHRDFQYTFKDTPETPDMHLPRSNEEESSDGTAANVTKAHRQDFVFPGDGGNAAKDLGRSVFPHSVMARPHDSSIDREYDGTLNHHGISDEDFLTSLAPAGVEKPVDPAFEELLSTEPQTGGNRMAAESVQRVHMAALEITIPIEYEYGDLTDPKRKKMNDFYRSLRKDKLCPVWSPDGQKIAFNDRDYGIWVVNADGGEPILIYDNYYKLTYKNINLHYGGIQTIGFSPDGSEVAFRSYNIDMDHGTKVIIDDAGMVALYYIENPVPVIQSVTIETLDSRILAESATTGSWSPDGRYFAYVAEPPKTQRELWVLDVMNGSSRRKISCDDPSTVQFDMDGATMLVTCRENDSSRKVVRIDAASGKTENLPLTGNVTMHDLSPDGRWLFISETYTTDSPEDGTALEQIRPELFDLETGIIHTIATDNRESSAWGRFSPDGSKLCLNLKDNGLWNIYLQDFTPPSGVTEKIAADIPAVFSLKGIHPNPFNLATTIEYSVAKQSMATLVIYNALGQKVRELVTGVVDAGIHKAVWDGLDDDGNTVSTGVYIAKLSASGRTASLKMMLMK